jgi:hypothetical protein
MSGHMEFIAKSLKRGAINRSSDEESWDAASSPPIPSITYGGRRSPMTDTGVRVSRSVSLHGSGGGGRSGGDGARLPPRHSPATSDSLQTGNRWEHSARENVDVDKGASSSPDQLSNLTDFESC